MTDYLLGALPEPEREAFEREFFTDPATFDQLLEVETALVDDYARNQMPLPLRRRFEEHYLAHPRLRDRLDFAQSLQATLAANASPSSTEPSLAWPRHLSSFARRRIVQVVAIAAALLLIASGWLMWQNERLRGDMLRSQNARQASEQRERQLQQQLAAERMQAQTLTSELERLRAAPPPPATGSPAAGASSSVVALFLSVRATRGSGTESAPTLVIPQGTRQIRVQLLVGQGDYPSYRVALKALSGPEIFMMQHLRPMATKAGSALVLTVPAGRFTAGDYVATLSGEASVGDVDDIGKALFRIEKR